MLLDLCYHIKSFRNLIVANMLVPLNQCFKTAITASKDRQGIGCAQANDILLYREAAAVAQSPLDAARAASRHLTFLHLRLTALLQHILSFSNQIHYTLANRKSGPPPPQEAYLLCWDTATTYNRTRPPTSLRSLGFLQLTLESRG